MNHEDLKHVNPYAVGQNVEVYSFGRWYLGTITKVGRTRVTVLYRTGSGATRDKAFGSGKVRALPESAIVAMARELFPEKS